MLTYKQKQLIKTKGKAYIPATPPSYLERGKVGDCFDTCILAAVKNGLGYVEGIARHPFTKEWILYAWVTDGTYAYDLTWGIMRGEELLLIPTEYIGIEMKTELVIRFMRHTGYKGVIANAWRYEELAEKILC